MYPATCSTEAEMCTAGDVCPQQRLSSFSICGSKAKHGSSKARLYLRVPAPGSRISAAHFPQGLQQQRLSEQWSCAENVVTALEALRWYAPLPDPPIGLVLALGNHLRGRNASWYLWLWHWACIVWNGRCWHRHRGRGGLHISELSSVEIAKTHDWDSELGTDRHTSPPHGGPYLR